MRYLFKPRLERRFSEISNQLVEEIYATHMEVYDTNLLASRGVGDISHVGAADASALVGIQQIEERFIGKRTYNLPQSKLRRALIKLKVRMSLTKPDHEEIY